MGELDEEFAADIVPRYGLATARRWYWRQAITSVSVRLKRNSQTMARRTTL